MKRLNGRIVELSYSESEQYKCYVERWKKIALDTRTTDHEQAAAGVQRLYAKLNLPAPKIVWCSSPLALLFALAQVGPRLLGKPVGLGTLSTSSHSARRFEQIFEQVISYSLLRAMNVCITFPLNQIFSGIVANLETCLRNANFDKRNRGEMAAFSSSLFSVKRNFPKAIKSSYMPFRNFGKTVLMSSFFQESARVAERSPFSCHLLAKYEFLHDVCGLRAETEIFAAEALIRQNCGWFLLYNQVAFLCVRHDAIWLDELGRLHNPNGAALLYPDGWGVHSLGGIMVPEFVIESPELICMDDLNTNNRVMIEKFGLTRYWTARGAWVVHEDQCGTLFRLTEDPSPSQLLRVINSTAEADGSFKEYFLKVPTETKTAREAVSWTFGLTENQYHPEIET